MSARVGVDIGGTFTDLVLRLADGTLRVSKVSSTPEDPGLAVVRGLDALLRAAGVPCVHRRSIPADRAARRRAGVPLRVRVA